MESESALHCGAVKSEWVSWFKVAETRESVLGLFKTLKRLCYQEFPRIKTPKPHGLTLVVITFSKADAERLRLIKRELRLTSDYYKSD